MNARPYPTIPNLKQHSSEKNIRIPVATNANDKTGEWKEKNAKLSTINEDGESENPSRVRKTSKFAVPTPNEGPHTRKPKDPQDFRYPQKGGNKRKSVPVRSPTTAIKLSPAARTPMAPKTASLRANKNSSASAPPLPGRQASQARVGLPRPFDIQDRLKKKSPWFQSIICPIKGGGTKIPDSTGTMTGTYQHVQNQTVSVGPNGTAGLRIISPYINSFYVAGKGTADGSNYQITQAASTALNLAWGDGVATGNTIPFSKIPALMKTEALGHRLVSASVLAQTEVSTLDDSGELVAFVTPFSCNDATVAYAKYQQQWDSSLVPANLHAAVEAKWYPTQMDYSAFDGTDTSVDISDPTDFISYQDFVDPKVPTVEARGVIPWELGVVCVGLKPGAVVRFRFCLNYEFVPNTQSSMVSYTPSPVDATDENLSLGWCADTPMTGIISEKEAATPPQESTVKEEPSGLGMLYNIIEEVVPAVLPMAKNALMALI